MASVCVWLYARAQAQIEREYTRRCLLLAYCKLIVRGLMPVDRMANVARHYVSHFNAYGDIMKFTLAKIRELDKIACARMMAKALIDCYEDWKVWLLAFC